MVRCSDNSSYYGDILVGADGAYSAVRQNLFKELKEENKLPSCDDVSLPFSCVCLVGQTVPLDPEEFPHLKEELCQFNCVLGISTMCTVSLMSNFLQPVSLNSLFPVSPITTSGNENSGSHLLLSKTLCAGWSSITWTRTQPKKRLIPQFGMGP